MRPAYVITTCGNRKMGHAAPAREFYSGAFVASQRRAARALRPREGWLVLSSKYGFLAPDDIVPGPYDLRWGEPGTISDEDLLTQISGLGLRPGQRVVCLGSVKYALPVRRLFPTYVEVIWPAAHLPSASMGYQMRLHKSLTLLGSLPERCVRECRLPLT